MQVLEVMGSDREPLKGSPGDPEEERCKKVGSALPQGEKEQGQGTGDIQGENGISALAGRGQQGTRLRWCIVWGSPSGEVPLCIGLICRGQCICLLQSCRGEARAIHSLL